jgi:hypothetical protein
MVFYALRQQHIARPVTNRFGVKWNEMKEEEM